MFKKYFLNSTPHSTVFCDAAQAAEAAAGLDMIRIPLNGALQSAPSYTETLSEIKDSCRQWLHQAGLPSSWRGDLNASLSVVPAYHPILLSLPSVVTESGFSRASVAAAALPKDSFHSVVFTVEDKDPKVL